jgi:hypothetical protein
MSPTTEALEPPWLRDLGGTRERIAMCNMSEVIKNHDHALKIAGESRISMVCKHEQHLLILSVVQDGSSLEFPIVLVDNTTSLVSPASP